MDAQPLRSRGYIRKETVEMDDYFLQLPRGTPVLIEVEVIPLTPEDLRPLDDITPEEEAEFERYLEETGGYPSRWLAQEE